MENIEDNYYLPISDKALVGTVEDLYLKLIKLYKDIYQDYIDLNEALDNYDKAKRENNRREKVISTLTISQILVDITDKTLKEVKIYKVNGEDFYILPYLREYILRRFEIPSNIETAGITYFDIYTKKEFAVFRDKPILIRMLRALDYFTMFEEEKECFIDEYEVIPDDITIKSSMDLDFADVLALNTLTYMEMPIRQMKTVSSDDEDEEVEDKETITVNNENDDEEVEKTTEEETEEEKKLLDAETSRILNKFKCLLAFTNLGVENKLLNEDFTLDNKFRSLSHIRFFQTLMTDSVVLSLLELQKNPTLNTDGTMPKIKKNLSFKDIGEIILHFKNHKDKYLSRKDMFDHFYIDNYDNLVLLSCYINQCYMQIGDLDFRYLDQLLNMSKDKPQYQLNDDILKGSIVEWFFNNNVTASEYRRIRQAREEAFRISKEDM